MPGPRPGAPSCPSPRREKEGLSARRPPLCPTRAPRLGRHCTIPEVVSPVPTKLANTISAATRLPLLAAPLFLAVGAEAAGTPGVLWGLFCLFLTSGLSLVYLAYLARSGKVRDPRSIPRAERVRPLRVVAALHAGAFLIVTLLTPLTNLSLHAAGVSGTAVCLVYVFGAWGLPAVLLVPLVWWARTVLGRHTPSELALGVLVGGGATWLAFQLVG